MSYATGGNTYNCSYYPWGTTYPSGYTCSQCGRWVAFHAPHNCGWKNYPGTTYTYTQTPHKCPVCEGHQTLPPGFYEDKVGVLIGSGKRVTCRTCNGLGMIWA